MTRVGDTLEARPEPDGLGPRPGGPEQIMIGATSAREPPKARVHRTGRISPSSRRPKQYAVSLWRHLDMYLDSWFDLS
jgi:hypothetical protein